VRKFLLQLGVSALCRATGAHSKSFSFKALEELFELCFTGLRKHQAALGSFAIVNFVKLAELADAIEVAEEIHDEKIVRSEGRKEGGPNQRRVLAAHGFATLGSQQLEAYRFDIGAEIKSFYIERIRRQLQRGGIEGRFARSTHTSDSAWGNCS